MDDALQHRKEQTKCTHRLKDLLVLKPGGDRLIGELASMGVPAITAKDSSIECALVSSDAVQPCQKRFGVVFVSDLCCTTSMEISFTSASGLQHKSICPSLLLCLPTNDREWRQPGKCQQMTAMNSSAEPSPWAGRPCTR
eukprot:1159363-Pelagomonas_calceolata.AAC.7